MRTTELLINNEDLGAEAGEPQLSATTREAALSIGDRRREDAAQGVMVGKDTARHVEELVCDAQNKGAQLRRAGSADGFMVTAMMVDGELLEMAIYSGESFGTPSSACHG